MYFGPGISVGRRGISYGDADAQAFISATGLTGTTEVNAVNNLVANLKTYGLWSKMKAIYPFVSDTTNLVSYSEEFTNAAWVRRRITVVDNAVASPLGTNTASTITEDSTTNTHEFGNPSAFTLSSSQNVTISIYVKKAGTRDWFAITMYNNSGVDKVGYYNISNGTLGNFDAGITGTITSIGNGWYRLSATGNFATTGNYFGFKGASANGTISYLGSGALQYYVWGAQLELGSTMTSYQKITTTSDARFVSQFKYNLKDPRDLDAAFRLAFNGTWAYDKTGATPNGTNAYADTKLIPNSHLSIESNHMSFYSRTQANTYAIEMGCEAVTAKDLILYHGFLARKTIVDGAFGTNEASSNITNTLGYQIGSRTSLSNLKLYWNNSLLATNTATKTDGQNSISIIIGATNKTTISGYSTKQVAFSTIGDGLSDTEATNLYTSVQQFNQDLSRQVGVPIVSDADAQSFLNAAQITDLTQANAINTLVVGLKNASLWTKMKAIYPFVGGTATTHKWNLKDPRDLDAAYRLAFFGAWTHSSTGALPNGTNAYADTFLNMASVLTNNNNHMSFYSRTNSLGAGLLKMDLGITDNTTHSNQLSTNYNGTNALFENGSTLVYVANANTTGMYIGSTTSSTSGKLYKNNTILGSSTTLNTYSLFSNKMYLSATNVSSTNTPAYYSNRQNAFTSIGDGLNDSEASTLYTLVQNFQTTLGRQV